MNTLPRDFRITTPAQLQSFRVRRELEQDEINRLAELRRPLPQDPPHLTRPVRVTVLKGFVAHGRALAVGEEVSIDVCTARDQVFLKRAALLPGETL